MATEASSATVPCWVTREEVVGRDAAVEEWDGRECEHPGQHRTQDIAGLESAMKCCYAYVEAMCDLHEGHDGEHVFVSTDAIVLMFAHV